MQEFSSNAFFFVFYEQLVFLFIPEEGEKNFFFFLSEESISKASVYPMFITSGRASKNKYIK